MLLRGQKMTQTKEMVVPMLLTDGAQGSSVIGYHSPVIQVNTKDLVKRRIEKFVEKSVFSMSQCKSNWDSDIGNRNHENG
jgi:hypothetical protein